MAWVYDTYQTLHPGQNNLPVVTGKPLNLGGSLGRNEATGRGCLAATSHFLELHPVAGHGSVDGLTVAVQGCGNVGSVTAELFRQAGDESLPSAIQRVQLLRTPEKDLIWTECVPIRWRLAA